MCLFKSYFVIDDCCWWENSCQFIIYRNLNLISLLQKQWSSLKTGVMCCVVYSLPSHHRPVPQRGAASQPIWLQHCFLYSNCSSCINKIQRFPLFTHWALLLFMIMVSVKYNHLYFTVEPELQCFILNKEVGQMRIPANKEQTDQTRLYVKSFFWWVLWPK